MNDRAFPMKRSPPTASAFAVFYDLQRGDLFFQHICLGELCLPEHEPNSVTVESSVEANLITPTVEVTQG